MLYTANPSDAAKAQVERSLRRFDAFIRYVQVFAAGVVGTEIGIAHGPENPLYGEDYRLFIAIYPDWLNPPKDTE